MKSLSLNEIESAVKGRIYAHESQLNLLIKRISIDTRKNVAESLYIPVKGSHYDGHDFIEDAFEKGALCVLSEKELDGNNPYILVDCVSQALLDLAEYYKSLFNVKTIAVTGSSGKTTTKDMIASVLSEKYKNVVKTEGNFNNEIGLPLTIFNIEEDTELLITEMGMNHFGEISRLSKVAKPDICIITNIGVAHIENLSSREGILEAKSEIFQHMAEKGTAVLNSDDDMLIKLIKQDFNKYFCSLKYRGPKVCFGYNITSRGIEGIDFEAEFLNEKYNLKLQYPGKFMVYNAMNAVITGKLLGLSKLQIEKGIGRFVLSGSRMKVYTAGSGLKIINDVYNSNPYSALASLEALAGGEGKKAAVLGDMLELGVLSEQLHYETGQKAALMDIQMIICIGKEAKSMYNGILDTDKSKAYYFESKEEFFEHGQLLLKGMDIVLVKASRAMEFEKIIDKLTRC